MFDSSSHNRHSPPGRYPLHRAHARLRVDRGSTLFSAATGFASRRPRRRHQRNRGRRTGGGCPARRHARQSGTDFTRDHDERRGRFRGLLLPSRYVVTVSLQRCSDLSSGRVRLGVGQTLNLPVTLRVSSVSQEVARHRGRRRRPRAPRPGRNRLVAISNLPNNGGTS